MPHCDVTGNGTRIFYRKYGHGSTKVLMIIGLAGTHDSWGPQIKGLTGSFVPNDEDSPATAAGDVGSGGAGDDRQEENGIEVCCFDNRGMGKSSVPTKKSEYTTTIMAKDALALMDHLGWKKAHVFGHSMGGMIACKLAAIAPDRICSLALLNVTGGGFECFPKIDRQMISLAIRFLRAKTPEQRALVDLETHYTKEYLDEHLGSSTRRHILFQEYVKGITSSGMQSNYGFEGQINACWTHKMSSKELEKISSSGFLISVIHGRYDIIAQVDHARSLAKKLQPSARMVELHGGHLVSHERPDEVNTALMELVRASKSNTKPDEWSCSGERQAGKNKVKLSQFLFRAPHADNCHIKIINQNSHIIFPLPAGWLVLRMPLSITNNDGANSILTVYNLLGKLQFSFLYFIGVIMMGYEQMRNMLTKPVRVGISDS